MATSILSAIQRIRKQTSKVGGDKNSAEYVLHKYRIEYDDLHRKVYANAEVHPDSLDKGTEMPENEKKQLAFYFGIRTVDQAVQVIDEKLGGPGYDPNYIPLNPQLNLMEWKMAEEFAYNHVKKGGTRHAQINFAFEYDNEKSDEICRPVKIYYYYALYQNNVIFGDVVDGIIENIDPRENIF